MADGSAWTGLQNVFHTIRDAGGDYHLRMIIPEGTVVSDPATGATVRHFERPAGTRTAVGVDLGHQYRLLGIQPIYHSEGTGGPFAARSKKGSALCRLPETPHPADRRHSRHHGLCTVHQSPPDPRLQDSITTADSAYPWLLKNFTPTGIKGLAFAALVAAIVSSLASMINSTATIFTMDIYKRLSSPEASEKRLVNVGRMVAFRALFIAMAAANPCWADWIRLSSTFRSIRDMCIRA